MIKGKKTEHLKSVFTSTYGILFFGTPHRGSDVGKWGSYLERICRVVMPKTLLDSQPQLLEALRTNSETLQVIEREFATLLDLFHIYYFHESKPTDVKGSMKFVSLSAIFRCYAAHSV